jgi:hypothetical protein
VPELEILALGNDRLSRFEFAFFAPQLMFKSSS